MLMPVKCIALLLVAQGTLTQPLQEGVAYAYPMPEQEEDPLFAADDPEPESKTPKKESPTAQHAKIGNVKVTADVENTDFYSQCKAEWHKRSKKREKEGGKRSNDEKKEEEKEEDYCPRASLKIEWNTKS